jgi:hypothetical protein
MMLILIVITGTDNHIFWFKAKARVQSTQFGVEARYIACNELEVRIVILTIWFKMKLKI